MVFRPGQVMTDHFFPERDLWDERWRDEECPAAQRNGATGHGVQTLPQGWKIQTWLGNPRKKMGKIGKNMGKLVDGLVAIFYFPIYSE